MFQDFYFRGLVFHDERFPFKRTHSRAVVGAWAGGWVGEWFESPSLFRA